MPPHLCLSGIVHAGALQRAVRKGEAAGFDDVHRHAEAGAQPQDGADVSGDLGLEQGDAHAGGLKA